VIPTEQEWSFTGIEQLSHTLFDRGACLGGWSAANVSRIPEEVGCAQIYTGLGCEVGILDGSIPFGTDGGRGLGRAPAIGGAVVVGHTE
jgi:hypothetical protein